MRIVREAGDGADTGDGEGEATAEGEGEGEGEALGATATFGVAAAVVPFLLPPFMTTTTPATAATSTPTPANASPRRDFVGAGPLVKVGCSPAMLESVVTVGGLPPSGASDGVGVAPGTG